MGLAVIAAYLIVIPLVTVAVDRIGGHDLARIAQLGLGLICAFVALRRTSVGRAHFSTVHMAPLALVGCLAVAATLHATVPTMAARELAVFAGMVAIALAVTESRDPITGLARVASIASAAYVTVILLLAAAGYLTAQSVNRAEIFVGYDNYRFFNHVQTAALPLAVVALTVTSPRTWLRPISWVSAVGGFALLFAVSGRGSFVGIAAGAVLSWVLFQRASFATVRNLAAAALLGLAAFAVLFWLLPIAVSAPSDLPASYYRNRVVSDESRFLLWRIAVTYVEQSPWLGIGPMHYAHYLNVNAKAAHPHNIYLQIAAEWGLPMLFLLLGLGTYTLRRMALAIGRCLDPRQRDCGVGLFVACIAIVVDGLFSGNFVMPVSQVWIAFTFGWAMAWMAGQQATEQGVPVRSAGTISVSRIAALCLVVSQVWLVWSVWPEVQHLDEHVKQSTERFPNPKMNPRFWSHGWF